MEQVKRANPVASGAMHCTDIIRALQIPLERLHREKGICPVADPCRPRKRRSAHPNPATVVEAPDTSLPAAVSLPPAVAPAARSNSKITVFTARKIVTLDPMQPQGTAVAVQDGRILSVGTLDQVKGWAGTTPVEVDTRFAKDVILPGFIEAHMHPHITGLLWEGVYIGRFDRYAPDGRFEKGLRTRKEVIEKIAAAAKKMGDNDKWLIAWGYQPEFYDDQNSG